MNFLKCNACTQEVLVTKDTNLPIVCCGEEMEQLTPKTTDEGNEKHVPKYSLDGQTCTVCIGEVPHPMENDHYIEWVMVETNKGFQRTNLCPGDEPKCKFTIAPNEKIVNIYAYCNVHGLWKN